MTMPPVPDETEVCADVEVCTDVVEVCADVNVFADVLEVCDVVEVVEVWSATAKLVVVVV
jgi:hypothetical protein